MKIVDGLAKKTKTVIVGAISMIFLQLDIVFALMAKGEKMSDYKETIAPLIEIRRWCVIFVATQLPFWVLLVLFN